MARPSQYLGMNTPTNQENDVVLRRIRHVRTVDAFKAFAEWAGVPAETAEAALVNIQNGSVVALLGSGAQGSGKDSVCPAVFQKIGIEDGVQCRVAHAIRAEMSQILQIIEASASVEMATKNVANILHVNEETAGLYTSLFFESTRNPEHGINVYERSERMRRALQWHGAEGRADMPNYWVKKTYQAVIPTLAEGRSVYLTDGRFPGEVDAGRTCAVLCVRLWVPEHIRVQRILQRDGIVPSEQTLRHPGETVLDGYWGLDAEVDNTRGLDETVAAVANLLLEHRDIMRDIS
jgi:hypothetical protein